MLTRSGHKVTVSIKSRATSETRSIRDSETRSMGPDIGSRGNTGDDVTGHCITPAVKRPSLRCPIICRVTLRIMLTLCLARCHVRYNCPGHSPLPFPSPETADISCHLPDSGPGASSQTLRAGPHKMSAELRWLVSSQGQRPVAGSSSVARASQSS